MLFFTLPKVCLQFVIVVIPDHTHFICLIFEQVNFQKAFFGDI